MTYISTVFASSARHDSTRKLKKLRTFPLLDRFIDWVEIRAVRNSTITALDGLTERQLRDIGVERGDVASVVDERLESLRRY